MQTFEVYDQMILDSDKLNIWEVALEINSTDMNGLGMSHVWNKGVLSVCLLKNRAGSSMAVIRDACNTLKGKVISGPRPLQRCDIQILTSIDFAMMTQSLVSNNRNKLICCTVSSKIPKTYRNSWAKTM